MAGKSPSSDKTVDQLQMFEQMLQNLDDDNKKDDVPQSSSSKELAGFSVTWKILAIDHTDVSSKQTMTEMDAAMAKNMLAMIQPLDASWRVSLVNQGTENSLRVSKYGVPNLPNNSACQVCCEVTTVLHTVASHSPRDGRETKLQVCSGCKLHASKWSCSGTNCTNIGTSYSGGPPDSFSEFVQMFGGQSGIPYFVCWSCFAKMLVSP